MIEACRDRGCQVVCLEPNHKGKTIMHTLNPTTLPSDPGSPDYFTGAVILRKMAVGPEVAPNKILRVEFSPGARTTWHPHPGGQILFVAAGRCRFQQWGGPVQEAGVGET